MADVNAAQARFNMIEQQIRPWEVLDPRVLSVLERIPREAFTPDTYRDFAFADTEIPLGHGQRMLKPTIEGRILQALAIDESDTALVIGTGSGYLSACVAALGRQVVSVEIVPELLEQARIRLAAQGVANVTLEGGDAARGWPSKAPYHVIAVTGSLPHLPEELKQQLAVGGRLFAVVGEGEVMEARLVTRVSADAWSERPLFETVLPPLANAPSGRGFIF